MEYVGKKLKLTINGKTIEAEDEAFNKWFKAQCLNSVADVDFEEDEDGNLTGKWSTEDDIMLQTIANDDVGIRPLQSPRTSQASSR